VDAVGPDVENFKPGDRVAHVLHLGAYAELVVVPAQRVVRVPDGLDLESAAAVLLQGATAHYLVESTFPLRQGHTALVHAAAGGVGLLLVQLAKRRGARVIGTVSTREKAELALGAGADEIVFYMERDFRTAARELTGGRGVDVVYDSVGATTFEGSVQSLRPRGMLALFGQSSGPVPPFDPAKLASSGSLFLTRPRIADYIEGSELAERAREVFQGLEQGWLRVRVDRTLPLGEAAEAHRLLESRQTAGKVLLSL
jgi:NADPH2:quinone reductase